MARRLIFALMGVMGMGGAMLVFAQSTRTGLSFSLSKRLDDSRVAMLPPVLPPLPTLDPIEQARAQALVDFLHGHRLYGQGGCDPQRDLCLPVFVAGDAMPPLPAAPAALLHRPVDGRLLADDPDDEPANEPANENTPQHTYAAQAGALIYAPYDGQVLACDILSGGRTLLTLTHEQQGGMRVFSVFTGQIDTDLLRGDAVKIGQPIGRARPLRDASTRVQFALIRSDQAVLSPADWLIQ